MVNANISNKKEGNNKNPFKENDDLKALLQDLNRCDNRNEFNGWRFSFLTKFDSFLDAEGSTRAEDAYVEFSDTVASLVKVVHQMEQLIGTGAISSKSVSVKGQQCLEEIKARSIAACDALAVLLPGSSNQTDGKKNSNATKDRGYSNYHMGAILIGDGFSLYGYLSTCDQILMDRKENMLEGIADKQILKEIVNYHNKLKIFCDVMADLGLYGAMMKSREMAVQDGDDEDDLDSILTSISEHTRMIAMSDTESFSDESSSESEPEPEPEPTPTPPKRKPKPVVVAPVPPPAPAPAPPVPAVPAPTTSKPLVAGVKAIHEHTPIIKKTRKKKDDEPDLPKTAKPKAKMVLPGMGRRGSMPAPPSRGKTPPTVIEQPQQPPQSATTPTKKSSSPASKAVALAVTAPVPASRRATMPPPKAKPINAAPPVVIEPESDSEEEEPELTLVPFKKSNVAILDQIMAAAEKENIPGLSSSVHHRNKPRKRKLKKKQQPKKPVL